MSGKEVPIEPTGESAESEIEITPEMIEAGAREVRAYDPAYDDPADVAERVFEAMMAASGRPLYASRDA